MTTAFVFTIVFATIVFFVAVVNGLNCHRKIGEVSELKTKLGQAEQEVKLLNEEVARSKRVGGISESSVLSLIGEMTRIENNLYHMEDVAGRKQIAKALDRMKGTLQAEDYTPVPLLGTHYMEGMQISAVFVPDERLPLGSSIIISVQKPQVNRGGRMIQAATVTVGQNV